jgi:hypothetical protein
MNDVVVDLFNIRIELLRLQCYAEEKNKNKKLFVARTSVFIGFFLETADLKDFSSRSKS